MILTTQNYQQFNILDLPSYVWNGEAEVVKSSP